MFSAIVRKTLRVPVPTESSCGDSADFARQLDVTLLASGFKLSGPLMRSLAALDESTVRPLGQAVVATVREMVGDDQAHNPYFAAFPDDVPSTVEFWASCVADALTDPQAAPVVEAQLQSGVVNLLDLPRYGRVQHSYEEMLEAHDAFLPSRKDRMTVLHLGGTLEEESRALFVGLVSSAVPLGESDRGLLAALAPACLDQVPDVPVRENLALVNQARLMAGRPAEVSTVTDVLRLACALSDGDVTLRDATRFRSLPRRHRKALMRALDGIVVRDAAALADVSRHRERFKRLGERLHPSDFPDRVGAQEVFAVARGDRRVRSLAARAELAFAGGEVARALEVLRGAPGVLFRGADRLLRTAPAPLRSEVVQALRASVDQVSGRVLLQLRQHLENRDVGGPDPGWRVFVNRHGLAWASAAEVPAMQPELRSEVASLLDEELSRRMARSVHVVVQREALQLALPTSQKTQPDGFGVFPRGSVSRVDAGLLRFFVHWRQTSRDTDLDLSCDLLDERFGSVAQLSFSKLQTVGGVHSGDVTEAPEGAFEAIELDLERLPESVRYVVPTVLLYNGEGFDALAQSVFGFMTLEAEQRGKPFEPRAVRLKSEVRGHGRTALPLAFERTPDGWRARWLHLFVTGRPAFNTVQSTRVTTSLLARALLAMRWLTVRDALERMGPARLDVIEAGEAVPAGCELFIGLDVPEDLPSGAEVLTPATLAALIPS
ncbi:MAG: hypothetical protein KTR31_30730 [Myxococcales bacterium]|nr:hypothetical protein [Myxococcales bacterium]